MKDLCGITIACDNRGEMVPTAAKEHAVTGAVRLAALWGRVVWQVSACFAATMDVPASTAPGIGT
jgi:hypothetical protein